jgi:hypothetical protein
VGIENRKSIRRAVRQPAMMLNLDGSKLALCIMLDVSASGAKLKTRTTTAVPEEFTLLLSSNGHVVRHCRVSWRSGTELGVQFVAGQMTRPAAT